MTPHSKRTILLLGGSAVLLLGGAVALWAGTLTIPDVQSLQQRKVTQAAKIYDRTGKILLDDLGDNITRTIVPISEISTPIQQATVAIEDGEFYEHYGIKPSSIIRAVLSNILIKLHLSDGYTQGGSTITQQVIKNSVLTTDKTLTRKFKEWILAIKLEQVLTKDQILETYLNESPYGGSIYGVEEASMTFFGKHAKDINLAEASYLAALPQAPTYYSPFGNHLDALDARRNQVLSRMRELGFITESEYEATKATKVEFLPAAAAGIRAPHFVFFVREQLEREFGKDALEENGWRVITTLDAELEAKAEEIVKEYALKNATDFNASNAGLVALSPQTGDILAMVGSRDYFDKDIDGNVNVTVAKRQPGSSFKPFVYAAAFEEGYAPETVLFDSPTQFSSECAPESRSDVAPCYYPGNYDEKYRGPMNLRDALAQSINIVALKVLYLVGISDAINVARSLGITTLEGSDRYGLTLVLGGGEVTLLDLTSAYGVFANEGNRSPYRAILKIEDRSGTVVKEYPVNSEQVLPHNIALTVSDVLSDNEARIPAFGANSALYIPGAHIAAKTGTTNDYRDAWIVGYTPTLAVGTWAGNNDNSPMVKHVAGFIVAPMWNEFFRYALTKYPGQPFPEPMSLINESTKPPIRGIWQGSDITLVDAVTGMPVPDNYTGATKKKVTVNVHDILYWLDKNNPTGPRPQNPNNDPQFVRWEYGARIWAAQNGYVDGSTVFVNN